MKERLLLAIALISILSCTYDKLGKNSLSSSPYQVGDILIYKSSSGRIDTIWVTDVESHTNPTDPLDIFPNYSETLFVTGRISLDSVRTDILGRPITNRLISLIRLESGRDKDAVYFVIQNPNDTLTNPTTCLDITDLTDRIEPSKSAIVIPANECYDNMKDANYDLKEFHWHQELGYTRLIYDDSTYIELIEFVRNQKSIMP